MARLDTSLKSVIGGKTAAALEKSFGMTTLEDLLRHYPRRYASHGELTDLRSLQVDEHVSVMARVESVTVRPMRQRRGTLLEAVVTDGKGRLTLTFFSQAWREKELRPGRIGLFSGKVGRFRTTWQLAHPDYQLLPEDDADAEAAALFASELIPIYPASSAMPTWKVSQAVRLGLDSLDPIGPDDDLLPPRVREEHALVGLGEALRSIHRPFSQAEVERARARLRFEEAFVLQAVLAQRRHEAAALPAVPRAVVRGGVLDAFDAQLPFALTAGQREVGEEIEADLARSHPMHRLLQGEVGSGKTVVALRAMLAVVDAGGQAAMLAPTEVLAVQHHRTITALLGPLAERGMLSGLDVGTRVALLTGSQRGSARKRTMLDAVIGEAGIVVGTHALLEDKVQFHDLGLVVVDEQHRFGVEQRAALAAKARDDTRPHVLVMTATPIPRTVAMTVFGDLEVSTLRELPAGRAAIVSHVVPTERPGYLERAWGRVREEVAAGHQVYVVCPRIGDDPASTASARATADDDEGDLLDDEAGAEARPPAAGVLALATELADGPLAGLRVGVMHGRLGAEEKDEVMRRFAAGPTSPDGLDVLVATTVVEVGVDVPEATAMVVMDADRFGVSQLHQLRGRVGRGSAGGLCLLVTSAPEGSPARERLDAVAATVDGFALSRLDLQSRREGDVLGAAQSGKRSSLRLLSVLRDEDVIADARDAAALVVDADPTLAAFPALARAVAALVDDDRADYLEKS